MVQILRSCLFCRLSDSKDESRSLLNVVQNVAAAWRHTKRNAVVRQEKCVALDRKLYYAFRSLNVKRVLVSSSSWPVKVELRHISFYPEENPFAVLEQPYPTDF